MIVMIRNKQHKIKTSTNHHREKLIVILKIAIKTKTKITIKTKITLTITMTITITIDLTINYNKVITNRTLLTILIPHPTILTNTTTKSAQSSNPKRHNKNISTVLTKNKTQIYNLN